MRPTDPVLQPLVRLDVDLGNDVSLGLTANVNRFRGADTILSPDGTRIVYVSQSRLFSRRLDEQKATELSGTEQAYGPFFSPDGQWVAFFAGGKLKKVGIEGGPAVDLCDAPLASGGAWGEDGNIIAALDIDGLARIPSTGGTPTRITELAPGEITHRWPHLIPGAKVVIFSAFTSMSGLEGATIEAMSLRDHRRKTVLHGGTWAHYVPTGHLIYIKNGVLLAVRFDRDDLEVRGTPVPVLGTSRIQHRIRVRAARRLAQRYARLSKQRRRQWLGDDPLAGPLGYYPTAAGNPWQLSFAHRVTGRQPAGIDIGRRRLGL
jgi:serine/threonine-protein kinase